LLAIINIIIIPASQPAENPYAQTYDMSNSCWLGLLHRTAIVTGGASGIGRAVVATLQDAGCHVLTLDLPHCDVSKREQVDAAMMTMMMMQPQQQQQQVQLSGSTTTSTSTSIIAPPPTILVNCAGITRDGFIDTLTEEDWDQVIDVNLKGTFNVCQSFLKYLLLRPTASGDDDDTVGAVVAGRSGDTYVAAAAVTASIVNVGSIVSERGNLGQVNYAASKGGVLGLTRALAKEVAVRHHHVRVNAVVPGFIATPMTAAVPDKVLSNLTARIALRRLGQPQDVANLVAFLASDRSSYITGEAIECSGMMAL
jgi:NAD(P)-dependent dehydrogenase (short-subunit alcohol dehydrogenase family)